MSNLTVSRDDVKTIEIRGAAYAVEPIPAGEFGVSAVRVTKLVNGEAYDLIRTDANVLECTCPDFVCRHEGNGTCCKHLAFAVANGLLPVARPGVPPITRKDVKRAEAFGIRLPVAPKAGAPKPAPVVAARPVDLTTLVITCNGPADAPIVRTTAARPADIREQAEWLKVAEAAPVDPDDVEGDPSTWPGWTDADSWELGPESPEPPAGTMSDAQFKAWKKSRADLLEGAPEGCQREAITPHAAVLRPIAPAQPGRRPFAPTDEDFAEELGWQLGRDGESVAAPEGWDFARLCAFYRGWLAGDAALKAETLEFDAWLAERDAERLDEIMAEPGDGWPMAERVEARGAILARI